MPATPLSPGTVLFERFELLELLGAGAFALAYLAKDRIRGDECVVKELAPEGVKRDEKGVLDLTSSGVTAQHLRQRFLEEVRRYGQLNLPSIMPVRAAFAEKGTAYYVCDYHPNSGTLERRLAVDGQMPLSEVLAVLQQLLDTLAGLHERRIYHGNIKPANILLTPSGKAFLLDFAGAREWYADATESHFLFFDSPYSAPEELTARQSRGPATDIYEIAAVAYHMLSGTLPPHSARLAAGEPLPSVGPFLPASSQGLLKAIDQSLRPNFVERPQTVAEFWRIVQRSNDGCEDAMERLKRLDAKARRLKEFSFERRQCPSCGDVLAQPTPLRKGICPVCHDGLIKPRLLSDCFCPICGGGVLREKENKRPLAICPHCTVGLLACKRKKPFGKHKLIVCQSCAASFEFTDQTATLVSPQPEDGAVPPTRTWDEWRELSGRPDRFLLCDTCQAQFDRVEDGRLRQMSPDTAKAKAMYPDEWAKIGAGLPLSAGNSECISCRADYFVDGDSITLLKAHRDPFSFAARYQGRLMAWDEVRLKGAGKESPRQGLICESCPTEFDLDGENLVLIRSEHELLRPHVGQSHTVECWHRLARDVPEKGDIDAFNAELSAALAAAFESGDLHFDGEEGVLWRGPALRLEEKGEQLQESGGGQLLITSEEISFGGMLRKWRKDLDELEDVFAEEEVLTLKFVGESSPVLFELTPVEFRAELESGVRSTKLDAENLAVRLSALVPARA